MFAWLKTFGTELAHRRQRLNQRRKQDARPAARPDLFTKPGEVDIIRGYLAYAFRSDLTLEDMLQVLNAPGSWQWREGDSAWYGDYLTASVKPNSVKFYIYEDDDQFVLNLFFKARGPQAIEEWERMHETMLEDILPSLGATEIEKTEPYDARAGWESTPPP